ncbi:MAG: protein kinase [Acidobacteriota bacterium]
MNPGDPKPGAVARWQDVERLLEAALTRRVDERVAFLAEACAGDELVRCEVESLLAQEAGASGFMSTPAVAMEGAMRENGAGWFVGQRLGSYQIQSLLGAGGMGEVYRAHDSRLGRDVAIKILPRSFASDPERVTRLEREARLLASLNHPNIGAIYGLENIGETPALVLELVDGVTLSERLEPATRAGALPLSVSAALTIAKQIADALDAAHEARIVHRDLKPSNIKITSAGVVKVLDFGLAKVTTDEASGVNGSYAPAAAADGTRAGTILGTPAYMSPEQARGQAVDKRADIWAFGCVLFEMLAGKQAYGALDTAADAAASIPMREPDWRALPPNTPTAIRTLLRRCLHQNRARRLADISDARLEIDDALTVPPLDTRTPPAALAKEKRPWIAWSGWVAVAVTLLALGVNFMRQQPSAVPLWGQFEIPLPTTARLPVDANFSLSPDGAWLVYFAVGSDGVTRLWVQAARDALLAARPLPGTEGSFGTAPFWSPDSHYLVFQSQGRLKKIDLLGSPAERLCDVSGTVLGGSWNRHGVIIFGTDTSGIWRVSAEGGVPTALTVVDRARGERVNAFPTFLPDGRHFLYSRISSVADQDSAVYVGSLDTKPEAQAVHRLTASLFGAAFVPAPDSSVGELLILRGSTLMAQPFDTGRLALTGEAVPVAEQVGRTKGTGYFAASSDGLIYRRAPDQAARLTWFDRQGHVVGTEGEPFIADSGPRLSPTGERAAIGLFADHNIDLWISEFTRGLSRLTSGPGLKEAPVWSPDGRDIAFASSRTGHFDLYKKGSNGEGVDEPVFASDENKTPSSWSRDGRFLLFSSESAKTKRDLWILPMQGDAKDRQPFAFLRTDAVETAGAFSPDMQAVAYASDESGAFEIYVRSFTPASAAGSAPAGPRRLVSKGGGIRLHWRSDGKELFYLALDGRMTAVDVTVHPVLHFGVPRVLFTLPVNGPWDVDAAGQRFLLAIPMDPGTPRPFTVVRHWQEQR